MVNNQDKIWGYFQNRLPEAFAMAKPRLDFITRQISRKADRNIPRVLNIGAGNGYLEESFRNRGWEVHSLDPDEKTIMRLVERGINAHKGHIERMPFPNAMFDFVTASEVLEHLTDEQRRIGIGEIVRTLKEGGWFIGTVPYSENLIENQVLCPKCGDVFHRWGHRKSFSIKTLSDELCEFLDVLEVRRTAFVAFRGRSLFGKIKSLVRLILAKYGEMVAIPSIYFCARKKNRKGESG
jgi:SAM-dependent methyltransferase